MLHFSSFLWLIFVLNFMYCTNMCGINNESLHNLSLTIHQLLKITLWTVRRSLVRSNELNIIWIKLLVNVKRMMKGNKDVSKNDIRLIRIITTDCDIFKSMQLSHLSFTSFLTGVCVKVGEKFALKWVKT